VEVGVWPKKREKPSVGERILLFLCFLLGCHSNAKNSHSKKHWDAHPLKGKKEKRGREEDRA
jgi:hypothetical protein